MYHARIALHILSWMKRMRPWVISVQCLQLAFSFSTCKQKKSCCVALSHVKGLSTILLGAILAIGETVIQHVPMSEVVLPVLLINMLLSICLYFWNIVCGGVCRSLGCLVVWVLLTYMHVTRFWENWPYGDYCFFKLWAEIDTELANYCLFTREIASNGVTLTCCPCCHGNGSSLMSVGRLALACSRCCR